MEDLRLGRMETTVQQLTVDVRRLEGEARIRDQEARGRDEEFRKRDEEARRRDQDTRSEIHKMRIAAIEERGQFLRSMVSTTVIVSSILGAGAGILAVVLILSSHS